MRRDYSLHDKYTLESGVVYMTGIQALVRLPLEQMRRDRARGLNTGTFISGYEGSPLGGYDLALQQIGSLLAEHNVRFVPGVNEDIAATSVMGSQTYQALPDPKADGVVGIWYGKGPGVDRSGDVFRHANLAGTGQHCGALALAGDDHVSKSSTIPHQSELSFFNTAIPALAAGSTQEVLDYGLFGIALSRFSGAWSALKLATDICDGGGTVEVSPERCRFAEPEVMFDGEPYRKAMNPLLIVPISLQLERELHERRLAAALEFARVNGINRIAVKGNRDRLGLVAAGKSYYDLMSALRNVGLDEGRLREAGIRVLKLGMVYPLEPSIVKEFAEGLQEVIVIEEKRSFLELQLRELLYNEPQRPLIFGKKAPDGAELFRGYGEVDAEVISRGLARWLERAPELERRLRKLDEIEARTASREKSAAARPPSYCSGCPHNRSTYLLEGQIAGGGIGCHGMAAGLHHANRGIAYIAQMGAEGAAWIGMAPFTGRPHLFQNIGDGTYFHSGRMAVNAAIAAGVNITYKVLFNGAVAMTGGQQVAGGLGIPALTRELEAAGASRIVVLTDDLSRYNGNTDLAALAEVRPREDLEEVLAELEKQPGASFLIYDQMCAAEKRRRRNRGLLPQPERRILINERVCEGCGDCAQKSNCISLHPVETEFGPKTRIHQSSCNADYSCLLGDCPSFVSVMVEPGTGLKRRTPPELPEVSVPEPARKARLEGLYHILMPGIGGTGVVTAGAVLATAALLDGRHVITLDQTGLAQKGGAVVSHLTLSDQPADAAHRISYGSADLLLGFDVLGASAEANLRRADPERTAAVVNSHQTPTGDMVRSGLTVISPETHLAQTINRCTRAADNVYLDASKLAEALFGSHMQTNIFLMGAAYQAGFIPVSAGSIEQALRLNRVAVERNLAAFRWGRKYVAAPGEVKAYLEEDKPAGAALGDLIEHRARELAAYQDEAYAGGYRAFVEEVRRAEQRVRPGAEELTRNVARYLYKLMAYKDEYEVARLLTDPAFDRQVAETFERPRKVVYHLHPPLLRELGLKKKLSLGPWVRPFLKGLARLKGLRGTAFDPFGWARMRREERALIGWYREMMSSLISALAPANYELAVEMARLPDGIRGYEEVKMRSIECAREIAARKLEEAGRAQAA